MGYLDTTQAGDGLISTYYAWDADSQLLARRDDNDNTTGDIYDNQGRLKDQRQGLNITGTSFSLTGGDSGSFDVALRGGVPPVDTQPNGTDDVMSYNQDEEETGTTDQRGDSFSYTYDALGRKTALTITPAAGVTGTTFQQWRYDGLGRLTTLTDNNNPSTANDDSLIFKIYDSLSRQVEEWQSPYAGYLNYVSYSYDIGASGSLDQPSATIYPDGRQVDNTYDELERLLSKTDHGYTRAIGTYQYLGTGQVASLTYQNNTRLTYISQVSGQNAVTGYDSQQRIVTQRWESFTTGTALGNGTLIEGFSVLDGSGNPAYDRENRPLLVEHLHDPGNSEVYTYGSSGELTSFNRGTLNTTKTAIATPTTTPGAVQTQTWSVDGNGNWTSTTVTTGGTAATENRTSTDYNGINAITGTPYGANVTGTLAYDTNGNVTNDGVGIYQWDALNRLQSVTRIKLNQVAATYTYDAEGRVISRTVTNGGLPSNSGLNGTTYFYYDGAQVIEERDANNGLIQQFVYGNGPQEVWTMDNRRGGVTVAQLNSGFGTYRMFYLSDLLGTVTGLTDETGALKEAYQYDAYGRQTVIDDGPDPDKIVNFTSDDVRTVGGASLYGNPFLFQGQRFSPETGLMSFGTGQVYDPSEGRFRRRDPMQDNPTNSYAFVGNGPTYATDPSGFAGEPINPATFTQVPSCMACHGTGVLQGRSILELSQAEQMAIMRWTRTSNPLRAQLAIEQTKESAEAVLSRVEGAGRIVGGTFTGIASVGLAETGIGAVAAVPLAGWSGDQLGTGTREIWQGKYQDSLGGGTIRNVSGGGAPGAVGAFAYDVGPLIFSLGMSSRTSGRGFTLVGEGTQTWTSSDGFRVFTSQADYIANERAIFLQSKTPLLENRGPILGGNYRDVRAANIGGDIHHMPADSASPIPRAEGPGIWMETRDHARTASFAGDREARAYRELQSQLIQQGRFMDAMQMDINDVRGLYGNKYDTGISQMLDWIRLSRQVPNR